MEERSWESNLSSPTSDGLHAHQALGFLICLWQSFSEVECASFHPGYSFQEAWLQDSSGGHYGQKEITAEPASKGWISDCQNQRAITQEAKDSGED